MEAHRNCPAHRGKRKHSPHSRASSPVPASGCGWGQGLKDGHNTRTCNPLYSFVKTTEHLFCANATNFSGMKVPVSLFSHASLGVHPCPWEHGSQGLSACSENFFFLCASRSALCLKTSWPYKNFLALLVIASGTKCYVTGHCVLAKRRETGYDEGANVEILMRSWL